MKDHKGAAPNTVTHLLMGIGLMAICVGLGGAYTFIAERQATSEIYVCYGIAGLGAPVLLIGMVLWFVRNSRPPDSPQG